MNVLLVMVVQAQFDVPRLAKEAPAGVRPREMIARAMALNGTHWDYQPSVDATRQYVR